MYSIDTGWEFLCPTKLKKKVEESFTDSILVKKKIVDQNLYQVLLQAGDIISKSIAKGGKLLICGNGGSAADAQHLAAEFLMTHFRCK